jgi:hypothetical protein
MKTTPRGLLSGRQSRALEAGDGRDAQHLHARGGDGRVLVALDLDLGGIALAVQDAAARVVDQPSGTFGDVIGSGREMLGGGDDAGRAGIHAEADRPAAAKFQPDLRHAIHRDRPVGEGDVECLQSAILRRLLCDGGSGEQTCSDRCE